MTFYKLSELHDRPAAALNYYRPLQTPAEAMDLENWLYRILNVQDDLLIMKNHSFFGDQLVIPVCKRADYLYSSRWTFKPDAILLDKGDLMKKFFRKIYPEQYYHLEKLINSIYRRGGRWERMINDMDDSLHRIFGTHQPYNHSDYPDDFFEGDVIRSSRLYVRYFLCNDFIYCIFQQIKISWSDGNHQLFDFSQIARNYDPQDLGPESVENQAVEVETACF
jgi:hypothetical protein